MKVYTLSFESSYDCGVLGIYSSKENAEAEAKILREKNADLEDDYGWLTIREVSLEDRKSTRLNSSHVKRSRMPSSA